MTALTKGRIPVLWIGFSQENCLLTQIGRSKACDMQSGSRSSKKLLASSLTQALSCGWRKDACEPQISAAEVSDTGMGLCGAQAPPRWHWSGFPVAGLQEEKAALYSCWENPWLESLEAQRNTKNSGVPSLSSASMGAARTL